MYVTLPTFNGTPVDLGLLMVKMTGTGLTTVLLSEQMREGGPSDV